MGKIQHVGALAAAAVAFSGLGGVALADSASAADKWCPYKVTASALKIRTGPGTNYTATHQVSKGKQGLGSEQTKNGFRQFDGGWASTKYLQRTGGLCATA
ncbi:SH3 domain-containing protein [Demetria terragena]|uniref:SH3 domain-containing protein n=1 Tax=Demetria terragena TaxID=63959 RepID=UPI00037D8888|nr:SH3 domain-containing protein [Demetria terragena]